MRYTQTDLLAWQLTDNSSTPLSRFSTKEHAHKDQNIQYNVFKLDVYVWIINK